MDGTAGVIGAWPQAGAAAVLLAAFGYVLRMWHLDRKAWREERAELIKGCDEQLAVKRAVNQELRADLEKERAETEAERIKRREAEERAHRAGLRGYDQ